MFYLYLDESGDLGFDFVNKKPSRFFIITMLAVNGDSNNRILLNAVKKTLKRKLNPRRKRKRIVKELKGSRTTFDIKKYFYEKIKGVDFEIYSLALKKKRVYSDLIQNKSRIYNFIARNLLDQIQLKDTNLKVELVIDKSKSKPEIVDFNAYIRRQLEARLDPKVPLNIYHLDSAKNGGLQAVDMFSCGFFEKYEKKKLHWFELFKEKVRFDSVYLP